MLEQQFPHREKQGDEEREKAWASCGAFVEFFFGKEETASPSEKYCDRPCPDGTDRARRLSIFDFNVREECDLEVRADVQVEEGGVEFGAKEKYEKEGKDEAKCEPF